MKIAVIGAGFVGLTTALGLCSKGHSVTCVDIDPARAAGLMRGRVPFFEPGTEELLKKALASKRFKATDDLKAALTGAEVSMICVGTPSTDKGIDLSFVKAAAAGIGKLLKVAAPFHVVTVKSTVVPGSVDTHVNAALEKASGKKSGKGFGLAMNPEFLREGCAVEDFMVPDRIVIGADDAKSAAVLKKMYAGFKCPVIVCSTRNAEMIKYASNALLATFISYANEIATICETVPGLSEETVMHGVFEDKRFWNEAGGKRLRPGLISYLRGGIGFGGSCFPKDVKALLRYAQNIGYKAPMLQATLDINESRSGGIVKRLAKAAGGSLRGKRVALLGMAFKPDTDDLRESQSLKILQDLVKAGAKVTMHDPVVDAAAVQKATKLKIPAVKSLEAALKGAEAAVIATSWDVYKKANWEKLAKSMKTSLIFDGRQVIAPAQRKGFTYLQTGRAS